MPYLLNLVYVILAVAAAPWLLWQAVRKGKYREGYREKLLVLDNAIAVLQDEVDRNRFNAHLRQELLSVYREKEITLRAILEESRS